MITFCVGCNKEHESYNWKNKDYEDENGKQSGWFCRKHFKPVNKEWIPEKVKEERKKFFKSCLQPFRDGEPSKEYIETYGDKGAKFTKKQKKTAKEVYKDLPGHKNWRKSL